MGKTIDLFDVDGIMTDFRSQADYLAINSNDPAAVKSVLWDLNCWLHTRLKEQREIAEQLTQ